MLKEISSHYHERNESKFEDQIQKNGKKFLQQTLYSQNE